MAWFGSGGESVPELLAKGKYDKAIELIHKQLGEDAGNPRLRMQLADVLVQSGQRAEAVPVLIREGIGVLGMKPLGGGAIVTSQTVTPVECLHYALQLPTSTVITGIDSLAALAQAEEAVRTFQPMTAAHIASLLSRTAGSAATGHYERFKTSDRFDATAHHPEWLG